MSLRFSYDPEDSHVGRHFLSRFKYLKTIFLESSSEENVEIRNTIVKQSFVHDLLTAISNQGMFIKDFPKILTQF